jgi:hypothetical protein
MVIFGDIHGFLQLSQTALFVANRGYLHVQQLKLQEGLLSQSTSILTGQECANASASNTNWFLLRHTGVS